MNENESYNSSGDATHYDKDRLNTIIKMERIWGTEAIMTHCEITAFKYRERVGKKIGQPADLDLLKATWYENAANYYYEKLHKGIPIVVNNTIKEGLPWNKESQTQLQFDKK